MKNSKFLSLIGFIPTLFKKEHYRSLNKNSRFGYRQYLPKDYYKIMRNLSLLLTGNFSVYVLKLNYFFIPIRTKPLFRYLSPSCPSSVLPLFYTSSVNLQLKKVSGVRGIEKKWEKVRPVRSLPRSKSLINPSNGYTMDLRKRILYAMLGIAFNRLIHLAKKIIKKEKGNQSVNILIKKLNFLMHAFFKYIAFLSEGCNVCQKIKQAHVNDRKHSKTIYFKKIILAFSHYFKIYINKILWKWVQKRDDKLSQRTLIYKYWIFIQNNARFYALI